MEELVRKAKEGDKEAFTILIKNREESLYKIARTRLQLQEDIDDAIQETMISAYTKIKRLKDNTKFYSWIIKILINKCNDKYKKNKTKIIPISEFEDKNYNEEYQNIDMDLKLEYEEILSILDYEEKVIIILYYDNGYTTREISKILKMNENTIKTKLRRAKGKIKIKIEGGILNG